MADGFQGAFCLRARTLSSQRYGLPEAILCDNGSPWGTVGSGVPWTPLRVWLCLLGVALVHGEPYHPQTQGKGERFYPTLKAEVLHGRWFRDLAMCQQVFDGYRHVYNHQRPHEALGYAVPASRYRVSVRRYPAVLPEPEYSSEYAVRVVQQGGVVHFGGRELVVPSALRGNRVGVRYVGEAEVEVRFCGEIVGYSCLEEDGDVETMSANTCPRCLQSVHGRGGLRSNGVRVFSLPMRD